MITLGTVISGAAVFFFMVPSHLAVASISGLAVLLSRFIPLTVGTMSLLMSLICLALSWFFIGRTFTLRTIYPTILLPLTIRVLEILFPNQQSIMGEPFVDLVCYMFMVDFGLAILFVRNSSSGGMDIIAKIMNKYLHMELGTALSIAGLFVSVPAIFIYDLKIGILSILGTYLKGIVLDHFIFGFSQKKRICILSDKHEEILRHILHDMHSGATLYEAKGGYDGKVRTEITLLVTKHSYAEFMTYMEKTDPNAFLTVTNVSEVVNRTWGKKAQMTEAADGR
ncbi:MAG: YitT family protein [Mogibacterium sp.]|nr:YitT family protein [Mogibacterium sp.]